MLKGSEPGNGTRAVQPAARRKFWGWGLEGQGLTVGEIEQLGAAFAARFGIGGLRVQEPPRVEELDLPAPRLAPPASLAAAFSTDPYDRAAHTYGRSFRDLLRAAVDISGDGCPWPEASRTGLKQKRAEQCLKPVDRPGRGVPSRCPSRGLKQ